MPRRIGALIGLLTLFTMSKAQPPASDTIWTKCWGGTDNDRCHSLLQTTDEGFVLAGETYSYGAGANDAFLLKTDFLGRVQWFHTYGGLASDVFESIVMLPDGGFAIGGKTSSWGAGGPDMWLVRTDSLGNVLWQHTYGGPDWDWCHDMIKTSDGGFALGGFTNNFGAGYYENLWLVKTDSLGNMQWQRSYGAAYPDACYSLQQTSDGGYILGGGYGVALPNDRDMYLVKTNAQGILQWQRTYGGPGNDNIQSVLQTPDGGFALGGTTTSFGAGNYDMVVVKTDSIGNLQWQHTLGANLYDMCYCMTSLPDGGYLLGGEWAGHFCIVKTDSSGNFQWQRIIDSPYESYSLAVCQTYAGNFAFGGMYEVYDSGFGAWPNIYLAVFEGVQNAWISMQPSNPPILIPPSGGSFQFNVTITNCGTIPCRPDIWIMLQLPSGAWHGPVLGPIALTLPAGGSIERLRTQNIPGRAPAGTYVYRGYVGDYPSARWDSSSFTFEKLGSGNQSERLLSEDSGFGAWTNTGPSFKADEETLRTYNLEFRTSVSPNPFNATTVASFELRAASHVSLRVYDTTGRLVETLVDGWREEGRHDVAFDASSLASGIYLCRLQAGAFDAVSKIVLVK